MGMDSIAAVEARIASIQQAFSGPTRVTTAPVSSPTLGGGPTVGSGNSFADALAQVTKSGGGANGVATSLLPRTGSTNAAFAAGSTSPSTTAFINDAVSQAGKKYVFGAEVDPNDPNPTAFDCSELVQWAAQRQGVTMREGSWEQYLQLKEAGTTMPVEQALRTPGALLFSFSHEPKPGEGRPSHAHVAISLGDGRTIEAKGRKYGVGVFDAKNRFTYAATIPGLGA